MKLRLTTDGESGQVAHPTKHWGAPSLLGREST
jgi:hypothetical protein